MFYYTRQGQRLGPHSEREMRDLLARGELTPQDLVWHEGMAGWAPLERVMGITAGITATSASESMPGGTTASDIAAGSEALRASPLLTLPPPAPPAPPPPALSIAHAPSESASAARIVYLLYLASFFLGVTGPVGAIIAYVNRARASDWLKSHYRFQIRTFWINGLYAALVILLLMGAVVAHITEHDKTVTACLALAGLTVLWNTVWYIVRCVKGLQALNDNASYPRDASWLW